MGRTPVGALLTDLEKSLFEDLGYGVSTVFPQHRLSIEDVDEDDDGEFNDPIQMDEHDRFQMVKMRIADNI